MAGSGERRLGPARVALGAGLGRGARAALDGVDRPTRPTPTAAERRRRRRGRRRRCSRRARACGRRGRRLVPRVEPRASPRSGPTTSCSTSRIDRSAGDLRLLVNDGPGRASATSPPACPWFTTLFGRDSIIASFQALARPAAARDRDARGAGVAPGDRRGPGSRRGAGQDPARAAHRRDGPRRRDPAPAVLRHGRRHAAVADAARRDLRLDRRPRAGRPAVAERAARRSTGSTSTATSTATGSSSTSAGRPRGLLNQGWKDSQRRDPRPARRGWPRARSRWPRSRATSTTPSGGWPRSRGMRGEEELARPPGARRRDAAPRGSRRRSGPRTRRFYAMALDGDKRQADAIASNAGPLPVDRHRLARRARRVVDRLHGARHVLAAGASARYASGQPGYNPIGYHTGTVWPHDDVADRRRASSATACHEEANRLVGRMFEATQHFHDFRLPELFCGFDRDHSPVPVPYPVACSPQAWAAGSAVPVPRDDAGPARRTPTAASSSSSGPSCPDWLQQGDDHEPARRRRRGRPAVPPLARRRRPRRCSARAGDLDVTIRM